MAEQGKNTMVAEWDEETGKLKSVDFIPPKDDGSEERLTEHAEHPIDTLTYPPEEGRGDLLRRLGGFGMNGSHVWGD